MYFDRVSGVCTSSRARYSLSGRVPCQKRAGSGQVDKPVEHYHTSAAISSTSQSLLTLYGSRRDGEIRETTEQADREHTDIRCSPSVGLSEKLGGLALHAQTVQRSTTGVGERAGCGQDGGEDDDVGETGQDGNLESVHVDDILQHSQNIGLGTSSVLTYRTSSGSGRSGGNGTKQGRVVVRRVDGHAESTAHVEEDDSVDGRVESLG